jgi:catechol 2,3-dioxygenase-like lactoylglutathione lyase family enzyme
MGRTRTLRAGETDGLSPLAAPRDSLSCDLHGRRQVAHFKRIAWLVLAVGLGLPPAAQAQAIGRITGVGGIFVRSKDPKALAHWYRDVLGIPLESWGGAMLKYDATGHPPAVTWNAFSGATHYMDPSTREFMIDFAVDDLDAYLVRLKAKGVTILKQEDGGATGKFAWILDPDGTKIELWQPAAK